MRRWTIGCAALVGLSFSSPLRAQVPDLIEVSAQYMPGAPLEDPRPTKVQVSAYDGAINVPIPLGERTFLIPGASYHVDAVSFADAPADFIELRAFHGLDFPLLFVQLLPADWALSIRVAPGLAGDFASVDEGLLRFNALVMATHGFSDDFVFGGGAMLTYAFGSALPLPALYLEYAPVPSLSVEAFLPAFVQAKVTIGDRLELGYRGEVQGNAYAVRDERIATSWPCRAESDDPATPFDEGVAQPADCLDHVAYSVVSVGPSLSVRLFATVWWNSFAGHAVFRRFEMKNGADDLVQGGLQDLPRSWQVRSGLSWRVPMD